MLQSFQVGNNNQAFKKFMIIKDKRGMFSFIGNRDNTIIKQEEHYDEKLQKDPDNQSFIFDGDVQLGIYTQKTNKIVRDNYIRRL